jgi:hypothetical protein
MLLSLLKRNEMVRIQIDEIITRLIRLSRQIREHQKIDRDAIAAKYEPRDKDEPSLGSFTVHLDWRLNESRQKMRAGFMKNRMRATMMARWRRLSYYTERLTPNESWTAASDVLDQPPQGLDVSNHVFADMNTDLPTPAVGKGFIGGDLRSSTGPRSHGLTLSTGFQPHLERTSIAPSRNTKSLIGVRLSGFPDPPELLPASPEFRCPFCGILQPRSMVEPTSWR